MTAADPYRGAMPAPESYALRVAGHVVRADSVDELQARLRLLGTAVGFTVHVRDDMITLTFDDDGASVTVEEIDELPN